MNQPPASHRSIALSDGRIIRRLWPFLAAAIILLGALAVYASDDGTPLKEEVQETTRSPEQNLLINPSFEGDYHSYIPPSSNPDCPAGICQTAQMSDGWKPYWKIHDPADDSWIFRMPEYKPADLFVPPPPRVRTGDRAQQYFTFWSTHIAGFYQRVPVQMGRQYCFTIWGHSWSSNDDNPFTSDNALFQKIGIDPSGGTSWESSNIDWGPTRQQPNEYDFFYTCSIAQSDHLTVFTYSQPEWAVKHNDVYWDDAELVLYEPDLEIPQVDGLSFVVDVDNPGQMSRELEINIPNDLWVSWNAKIENGGTIIPTLSSTGGIAGDNLTVHVDSTGFSVGTYQAELTITSTPYLTGSPATIPITLTVLGDFYFTGIPYLTSE
jgi:hypothetical protein